MRTRTLLPFTVLFGLCSSCDRIDPITAASAMQFETRPSGVRVAVLYGSPESRGPFGLRLQYPAGYTKGPHYHPHDAFVTVLRGSYFRGYGTAFDRSKGIRLVAGTFSVNPERVAHYEWVEEPAELEVHAFGPWGTVHVDETGQPVEGQRRLPALSAEQSPPVVLPPGDLRWRARPGGGEVALLFGDPAEPGPFVLRVRSKGGSREIPHVHPQDAFVTVLSGGFRFGTGEAFSPDRTRAVHAFDLLSVPANLPHFSQNDGPSLIEVHATGPWPSTGIER